MTSNAGSGRPSGNGPVGVSGPTKSLWLRLLALSSAASGGALLLTGLTAKGRTEKPAGAWTAEQTVDFMLARLEAGDFYILCPDNDVPRALDEKRMLWAAGDIVENRPPLSRWHPDYADAFAKFVKGE